MQSTKRIPNRFLILVSIPALVQLSFAAGLPDLPEAMEAGWKGKKMCEVLYENSSARVGRCIFPPGTGHEKHFHYPHFGYVLEGGELKITDHDGNVETRQTVTGKSWSTDEITIHEAINIGETTTSYLIIEPRMN